MQKELIHDHLFLALKAEKATVDDTEIGTDLVDTLKANLDRCVGMAANMIGINKCIIAVCVGNTIKEMYNPVIVKKASPYKTTESCLSVTGVHSTIRYKKITVEYYDRDFVKHKEKYADFEAQIIQHECDHLHGVLI